MFSSTPSIAPKHRMQYLRKNKGDSLKLHDLPSFLLNLTPCFSPHLQRFTPLGNPGLPISIDDVVNIHKASFTSVHLPHIVKIRIQYKQVHSFIIRLCCLCCLKHSFKIRTLPSMLWCSTLSSQPIRSELHQIKIPKLHWSHHQSLHLMNVGSSQ